MIFDREKYGDSSSAEEMIGRNSDGFSAVTESRKGPDIIINDDPYGLDPDDKSVRTQSIMSKASSQQLKRSLKSRHLAVCIFLSLFFFFLK